MILLHKISEKDLIYKDDINQCLIHNISNKQISKIIIFSNVKDLDKKIGIDYKSQKLLLLKIDANNFEILSYGKKNAKRYIIFSTPFIKFNDFLLNQSIISKSIEENKILKEEHCYYFFNKKIKISNSKTIDDILIGEKIEVSLPIQKFGYYKIPGFHIESTGWDINTGFLQSLPTVINVEEVPKKNISIKKNRRKNRRIDVIIVSVNYNDFLLISLENNFKIFENITVVTSSSDFLCQKICEKFGINCVVTDVMYDDGALFNKGKAINEGIKSISNPDYILLLDADIIIMDEIDVDSLKEDVLYTSDRYIIFDYDSYRGYLSGDINKNNFILEENKGFGFFQLFNYAMNVEYPELSKDASRDDLVFRDKFDPYEKIDNTILHLGVIEFNWQIRKAKSFLTYEMFNTLLNSISEESMNDEVSNIRPIESLDFLKPNDIVDYKMNISKCSVSSKKDYLSVVITNWRRPERLKMCLESVVNQNVSNIVVSCFDFSEEVREVIDEFLKIRPDIKLDLYSGDNGCNQLWIRGVYQAKTKYVMLLHDDDFLSERFEYVYKNVIRKYMNDGYGYFLWNGQVEKEGEITDKFRYLDLNTGVYDTDSILYRNYKNKGNWPISPVVQIFDRNLLIRTLKECESNFNSSDFYTKEKMMLGNEILTTLRHFEKFEKFVYIDDYLSKFGSWEGSESILNEKSKSNRLMIGYDAAKEYFSENSYDVYDPTPYIIHVSSVYIPKDPESVRRVKFAQNTWQYLYEKYPIVPDHIYDGHIGKSLPNIKDLIDDAFGMCADNDIIMYTNSDICLSDDSYERILESCKKWECTFSFRKDFKEKLNKRKSKKEIEVAEWYVGADLFAFTRSWWERWRNFIPDGQIIGRPTWDWVFRIAMGYSIEGKKVFKRSLEDQGAICETKDISYHEKHDSFWEKSENIFIDENIENSKIAYQWMLKKSGGNFTGRDYFEKTYGDRII